MVKKLLKYEFQSFAKTILPMELILLGIAVMTRFVQFFEDDSKTFSIFMWSSGILLGIAMIVCVVMTSVVCLVRFYKNLYTAEGYLTLALPVTHSQHIFAKLFTSVCASFFSLISVILAFAIGTAGDVFHECVKVIIYLAKTFFKICGIHSGFYIAECIIGLIVAVACSYLLFFACITLGQMAHKNRILAAFGFYFAYYTITQIIGTVLIVLYSAFGYLLPLEEIMEWTSKHEFATVHIIIIGITVIAAALGVVFYAITHHIMKKKLNLE